MINIVKINNVNFKKEQENNIYDTIMLDFLNFKNKNELLFCSLHQEEIKNNEIDVIWTTTKKFLFKLNNQENIKKINDDLNEIEKEINKSGIVSKVTCSDNSHIVEFSFHIKYKIE